MKSKGYQNIMRQEMKEKETKIIMSQKDLS